MHDSGRNRTMCLLAAAAWMVMTIACATTRPVQLGWEDQNPNKTVYRVERREGPYGSWQSIAVLPPGSTGFTDTEAKPGVQYYYRIQAITPEGQLLYSNELGAKPPSP
jgi:hypothetical protein